MSTTAATPGTLSQIFDDNVGPNPVTVLTGPINISSSFSGPTNGPKHFDIVLRLSTPFLYDPTKGNLLVDIENTSGSAASPLGGGPLSNDASRVSGRLSSSSGTPDPSINAVEIVFVPVANHTIVPALAATEIQAFGGGSFNVPNTREQEVYDSSQFLPFPILITELRFAPDFYYGKAFSTTIENIKINLSTTAATPGALSPVFADNVGPHPVTVLTGPVTISSSFSGPFSLSPVAGPVPTGPGPIFSSFSGPTNGLKNFDIIFPLSTPYLYNPAEGNLLVDIEDTSGSAASALSGGSFGGVASRVSGRLSSPTGFPDTGINALEVDYLDAFWPY